MSLYRRSNKPNDQRRQSSVSRIRRRTTHEIDESQQQYNPPETQPPKQNTAYMSTEFEKLLNEPSYLIPNRNNEVNDYTTSYHNESQPPRRRQSQHQPSHYESDYYEPEYKSKTHSNPQSYRTADSSFDNSYGDHGQSINRRMSASRPQNPPHPHRQPSPSRRKSGQSAYSSYPSSSSPSFRSQSPHRYANAPNSQHSHSASSPSRVSIIRKNEKTPSKPTQPPSPSPAMWSRVWVRLTVVITIAILVVLVVIKNLFFSLPPYHFNANIRSTILDQHQPQPHPPASNSYFSFNFGSSDSSSPRSIPEDHEQWRPAVINSATLVSDAVNKYSAVAKKRGVQSPVATSTSTSWWGRLFSRKNNTHPTSISNSTVPTPISVFSNSHFANTCVVRLQSLDFLSRTIVDTTITQGVDVLSEIFKHSYYRHGVPSSNKLQHDGVEVSDVSDDSDVNTSDEMNWSKVVSLWTRKQQPHEDEDGILRLGDGNELKTEGSSTPKSETTHSNNLIIDLDSSDLDYIDDVETREILSTLSTPLSIEELRLRWTNITHLHTYLTHLLETQHTLSNSLSSYQKNTLLLAQKMLGEEEFKVTVCKPVFEHLDSTHSALATYNSDEALRVEWEKEEARLGTNGENSDHNIETMAETIDKLAHRKHELELEVSQSLQLEEEATEVRRGCDVTKQKANVDVMIQDEERKLEETQKQQKIIESKIMSSGDSIVTLLRRERDLKKQMSKKRRSMRVLYGGVEGVEEDSDNDNILYAALMSELQKIKESILRLNSAVNTISPTELAEEGEDEEEEDASDSESSENTNSTSSEDSNVENNLVDRLNRIRARKLYNLEARQVKLEKMLTDLDGFEGGVLSEADKKEESEVRVEILKLRDDLLALIKQWESVRLDRLENEKLQKQLADEKTKLITDEKNYKQLVLKLFEKRAEQQRIYNACVSTTEENIKTRRATRVANETKLRAITNDYQQAKYQHDMVISSKAERENTRRQRRQDNVSRQVDNTNTVCDSIMRLGVVLAKCEVELERLKQRSFEWTRMQGLLTGARNTHLTETSKINIVKRALSRALGDRVLNSNDL